MPLWTLSFELWSRQRNPTARVPMPKKKKQSNAAPSLHLALPATSANLGPAFDAAAQAMDIYSSVAARPSADFSIHATGRDEQICGAMENHLILTTYREVLESQRAAIVPLALRIKNDIPIGKGCGSSAAARLAGIAPSNHFFPLRRSDAPSICGTSPPQRHPHHASPGLVGG